MSSNVVFNGKSQNNSKFINRAPGSERCSATKNNSFSMPTSTENQFCHMSQLKNSCKLNLAPGSNRPYAMRRSSDDSSPSTSERSTPNSEPSFPIHHRERFIYTDLAPGSNRPLNISRLGPHNSSIGSFSSLQVAPLNDIIKKPIVVNSNESKACDTCNNGEFTLSQCQDYNNSFYDRCVDHQRLRITCDHRIIKFSKDVRNVPHSLCVGSTQAATMANHHRFAIDSYRSYHHLATQLLSVVNNVERKASENLVNELDLVRTSVCNQIEKYSALEAHVQTDVMNVEMKIKEYFERTIELLERRERELLKYLDEQKNKQLKVLNRKIQDFNEYNLKITQLHDALACIQNSNNLEEIKKINESVCKEIKSLNYKMNGITQINPLVVLFEEADIRMQHNIASLGYLRTRMIEITNEVVMKNLCRMGRAILGLPRLIEVQKSIMPACIGEGILCRPWGACCDQIGNIYVGDRSNHRIAIFDAKGNFSCSIGKSGTGPLQFNRPSGIAIDLLGRLIVADKDNHRIQILTTAGILITTIGGVGIGSEDGQFHYPWDVAVNMDGDIVVADSRNKRIQLFDLHGNFKGKFCFDSIFSARKPKGEPSPRSVCFTPDGDILVTDFQNLCVVAISHDLKKYRVLQFDRQFARPQGVACDDYGNIIVADSRDNQIKVFRNTGEHYFTTGQAGTNPGELERANGLCLTPNGNIIAADLGNNRLVVF